MGMMQRAGAKAMKMKTKMGMKMTGEEKEEREVPFQSGLTSTDSLMVREPGPSSASSLLSSLLWWLWGLWPSTEGEGRGCDGGEDRVRG